MSHPMTNSHGVPLVRAKEPARRDRLSFRLPRCPMPLVAAAGFAALGIAGAAIAQDGHSNPWLLSWIPPSCCVTNDCCWEVSESDLRPLAGDRWEVRSTGQVLRRTDWSPDGRFYRCACDFNGTERSWTKHQGANTRCLFVPMRTAGN